MIVAAGLTPAWQQILAFDSFQPGEVNRAREAHWCASGKVFNVGIALAQLGAESALVAPLAADVAPAVQREFARLGAQATFTSAPAPTRTCTTILDQRTGAVTELVENARPLESRQLEEFVAQFTALAGAAGWVVLSGSLPAGAPPDIYRRLLERTPARAIVDARGPELLAALELKPFLIKPNREELARTLDRPLDSGADLLAGMRELNDRGAAWVLVTQGREAVWVSSAHEAYCLRPLVVERVVNPIGCGDCLAAGLAWALDRGAEPLQAIRVGLAAAAQNAAQLLPGRLNASQAWLQADDVACERWSG